MPYKTGTWGKQAKSRNKKRLEYFKEYTKKKYRRAFNSLGSLGELIALKILNNSMLMRKPNYDLLWQNKKIEVKISHFRKDKCWDFSTRRQKGRVDWFFIICLNNKNIIEKIYFIPDDKIVKGLRIKNNKYSENKWGIYRIKSKTNEGEVIKLYDDEKPKEEDLGSSTEEKKDEAGEKVESSDEGKEEELAPGA